MHYMQWFIFCLFFADAYFFDHLFLPKKSIHQPLNKIDVNQILLEKQFDLFKSQNLEEGFFDGVFEIDGKKIYADKFRLASISTTFRSMLSKKWNSVNEPILIKRYKFEDFKEFLTFIYSGECNLTDENIFAMIDISEFFNVEILTNICDEFASKMEISNKNAFQMLELANKYSLMQLKQTSFTYLIKNLGALNNVNKFLSLDAKIIKELIIFAENRIKHEDIFEAVYKWAEHQAKLKNAASNEGQNFNLNDAIKNELLEFLPHIQFRKMKLEFLHKFVVLKAFIFPSFQELSDILSNCNPDLTVKALGPNGQMMHGIISSNDSTVEAIKSLKKFTSIYHKDYNCFWWVPTFTIPSSPSHLKIKEEVEWYLIYFPTKRIGIRHRSEIEKSNYLIAEMFCETNITAFAGWKIEIL